MNFGSLLLLPLCIWHFAFADPAKGFEFWALHVACVSLLLAFLERVSPAATTSEPAILANDTEGASEDRGGLTPVGCKSTLT